MDQPLKQRLIGVTLVVALVVIFVPMLFEKSDDKGKLSTAGIPSIPEDVMEKPLELPKTAEDLAPKEEEQEKKAAAPSGFTIVPFNEEATPKPKPSSQATAKPVKEAEGAAPVEGEDAKTVKKPGVDSPAAQPTQAKPVKAPATEAAAKKPVESKKPPKATAAAKSPQPAPDAEVPEEPDAADDIVPAQEPAPSLEAKSKPAPKAPEPVAKKAAVVAKPQTSPHPVAKPVKVVKPNPPAPSPDLDDEEGNARPAKPEAAAAKPKAQAAPPRQSAAPVKKAEPAPEAIRPQPAKATPSPKPAAESKPAPSVPVAAKAPPKKPSSWVVQAGSFTDEAAARVLADKLKQSKLPAAVHAIHGEHGSVYKVQIAEPDRGRAEETLKQIEGSTGINGIITERH